MRNYGFLPFFTCHDAHDTQRDTSHDRVMTVEMTDPDSVIRLMSPFRLVSGRRHSGRSGSTEGAIEMLPM
jgi:hypothetical protein